MILAAGRGERMRPLTDTVPKPLLFVAGKSLIQRNITRLKQAGVSEFVVNTAWLASKLHRVLGDGSDLGIHIVYSDEGDEALETGGGVLRALPLLGDVPFWLVNGDVLCDFDYTRASLAEGMLAHLILIPNPDHNPAGDFALHEGRVLPDGSSGNRYTFAGISILHPDLLGLSVDQTVRFPLAPLLRAAAEQGKLSGEVYHGQWIDVGTAERLAEAEGVLLADER